MTAMTRQDLQAISQDFILGAPASQRELDELKLWFGCPLPQQLVELLQLSNGIAFRNPYLPPEAPAEEHVHGCKNIAQSTEILRRTLSDRATGELGDLNSYLFFGSTWNGDLVGYVHRAGENTLILIDHETGKVDELEPQDLFEVLPELDPYAEDRE